jgi:chemotaxis protein methyltransferase CheR
MDGIEPQLEAMTPEAFRLLADLVQAHCGIHLREEMRFLVERRIGARVRALGLPDFGAYYRYLRYDAGRRAELETAVELLATHETYLFREPLQLRAFSREVLPELAERRARERRLHIWSAGCSTGEEAYTAAILLKETGLFEGWEVRIFGSDIARRALAAARTGAYGGHAFRNPEAEQIRRWFRLEGDRWVVADAVRSLVSFGYVNLLDPGTAGLVARADLVFCRNVLIYFDLPERRRAVQLLSDKLADGGYLLLGHAETLLDVTADFELVQLRHDLVYRKPPAAP